MKALGLATCKISFPTLAPYSPSKALQRLRLINVVRCYTQELAPDFWQAALRPAERRLRLPDGDPWRPAEILHRTENVSLLIVVVLRIDWCWVHTCNSSYLGG